MTRILAAHDHSTESGFVLLFLLLTAAQLFLGQLEYEIQSMNGSSIVANVESLKDDVLNCVPADGADDIAGLDDAFSFDSVEESSTEYRSISLEQVLSIRPKSPTNAAQDLKSGPIVKLLDGSSIRTPNVTSDGKNATVTLANKDASVGMPHVASFQFIDGNDALMKQWDEIRNSERTGDVLVIRKGNESLDYLEGVVGEVTTDNVKFTYDGDEIDVKREKLFGILFYSARGQAGMAAGAPAKLQFGASNFNISNVEISGATIRWTSAGGAEFSGATSSLRLIDFGADKIAYLADTEPATLTITPRFKSMLGSELDSLLYAPRKNKSFDGAPLQLRFHSAEKTESWSRGLAAHSRTELQYRLNREYRSLKGIVGMDPTATGTVQLVISADDESLLDRMVNPDDEPFELDLDLSGRRRVTILVDYGDQSDVADRLHFCDLRIVK